MPSYAMDAYSAGRADMALIPEMMQLGQIRQMRQGLDQNDLQLRQMQREEQAAFDEADEFADFEEVVKGTVNMTPQERAKAFENDLLLNPSRATNPRIMDAIDRIGNVSRGRFQAKTEQIAEMQLDEQLAMFETDSERRRNESMAALEKTKLDRQNFESAKDAGAFNGAQQFGSWLGSAGNAIDVKSKEKLALMADSFASSPEHQQLIQGLGNVVVGFGSAGNLMDSFASEMGEHQSTISWLGEKGVNLDPSQDPESFKASFEKAKKAADAQANPQSKKKIMDAAVAANEANAISFQSNLLKSEFAKDLESVDPSDPAAARALALRWNVKAGELSGMVEKQTGMRAKALESKKNALDLQKKTLEVLDLMRAPEREKFDQEIARKSLEIRRLSGATSPEELKIKLLTQLVSNRNFMSLSDEERSTALEKLVEMATKATPFSGTNGVSLLGQPRK